MSDDLKKIKELSNTNFFRMLKLVELGLAKWWMASTIIAVIYEVLTEEQKEQVRRSYREKFGKALDIDPFLELGKGRNNKFEEAFFLPYENHVKHHETEQGLSNLDPDCVICQLIRESDADSRKPRNSTAN